MITIIIRIDKTLCQGFWDARSQICELPDEPLSSKGKARSHFGIKTANRREQKRA